MNGSIEHVLPGSGDTVNVGTREFIRLKFLHELAIAVLPGVLTAIPEHMPVDGVVARTVAIATRVLRELEKEAAR